MTKKQQFSVKICDFWQFGRETIKNGLKKVTKHRPSIHKQKGCYVKTIEQMKSTFSPKDASYNLTKNHHVSVASVDYSGGRGGGGKRDKG